MREHLRILGVPDSAAIVEIMNRPVFDADSLRGRIRPPRGGIQHQFTADSLDICTISFAVDHWQYGRTLVSASHCTDPGQLWNTGLDNTVMQQPTWGSPNRIAVEVLDPLLFTGGACPGGKSCRYSDAALFAVDDSVSWTGALGKIARPTGRDNGSLTIDASHPTFNIDTAYPDAFCVWSCNWVGITVDKVGRSTGWTRGSIASQCYDYFYGTQGILCTFRATYNSDNGDSGAPVFRPDGLFADPYSATLMGVHFANDGTYRYFSYIDYVRTELGGSSSYECHGWQAQASTTWCYDPSSPSALSVSISGPDEVPPSQTCEWYANVSGGTTPYYYQWSGVASGTDESVQASLSQSGNLSLIVTDSDTQTDGDMLYVTVNSNAEDCPF